MNILAYSANLLSTAFKTHAGAYWESPVYQGNTFHIFPVSSAAWSFFLQNFEERIGELFLKI